MLAIILAYRLEVTFRLLNLSNAIGPFGQCRPNVATLDGRLKNPKEYKAKAFQPE